MVDQTEVLMYLKNMLADLVYVNSIIATELITITENLAAMRHGEDFLAKSSCIPEHNNLKKYIVNIAKTYKRTPPNFLEDLEKHVLKHLE